MSASNVIYAKNNFLRRQKHVTSIPCDFKFLEIDPQYPEKVLERIVLHKYGDTAKLKSESTDSFECEERDDDFVPEKSS